MKDYRMLLDKAKEAMVYAYAPYSHFKVGAALITASGKVYTGCNIENAAYGSTNCAERTAVFKAVSEGEQEITDIAIVSSGGDFTYPCGICRQVISEFINRSGNIIFENNKGEIKIVPFHEIYPYSFTKENLIKKV